MAIDVVVAKDEVLSPSEKCLACEGAFEPDDCIVRLREFRLLVDYLIHRRCMIAILDRGPVDDQEFKSYAARLAERYTG